MARAESLTVDGAWPSAQFTVESAVELRAAVCFHLYTVKGFLLECCKRVTDSAVGPCYPAGMRIWLYRVLLTVLWTGGMGLIVIYLLEQLDGRSTIVTKLMLLVGGFVASISTVALAEEVAEVLAKRRAAQTAEPRRRELSSPLASPLDRPRDPAQIAPPHDLPMASAKRSIPYPPPPHYLP